MFAEAAWDAPLQQGEQEILLPNKSYTGSAALAPALASALPGFASPQLAPAKSFTATFLKKAASKSATPKKVKKAEKVRAAEAAQLSASEPKKKRINFALTQNKEQDFVEHLAAVRSSPGTPHDPSSTPAKTLLKKRGSLEAGAKKLNPVNLNTQLNGRSKTAKILKRNNASDFF